MAETTLGRKKEKKLVIDQNVKNENDKAWFRLNHIVVFLKKYTIVQMSKIINQIIEI